MPDKGGCWVPGPNSEPEAHIRPSASRFRSPCRRLDFLDSTTTGAAMTTRDRTFLGIGLGLGVWSVIGGMHLGAKLSHRHILDI